MRAQKRKGKKALFTFMLFTSLILLFLIVSYMMKGNNIPTALGQTQIHADTKLENLDIIHSSISSLDVNNDIILVNANHLLHSDLDGELVYANSNVAVYNDSVMVNSKTLKATEELFNFSQEAGYSGLFIRSGFRSYQEQKELYDNAIDKSFVQVPGGSEHETGYAIDINNVNSDNDSSDVDAFLAKNCWKFGFILRCPKDKVSITGISYEPWHFRYIGVPHAFYCYKKNLCLEEYISHLEKGNVLNIKIDSSRYTVYYTTEDNGYIKVPSSGTYSVSRVNSNGYIVTIKE